MNTRRIIRILSVILAIALVFQLGAVEIAKAFGSGTVTKKVYRNVYTGEISTSAKGAKEDEAIEALTGDLPASPSVEEVPVRIVEEVPQLRDAYSKNFINEGGSFTAVRYSEPVHYLDQGDWQPVDYTPILMEDGSYQITKTATPISFPADIRNGRITVQDDSHVIAFGVQTNEAGTTVSENEPLMTVETEPIDFSDLSENERVIAVDTKHSAVTYSDVFVTGDLKYEIGSAKLKESIVVNEPSDVYSYGFYADFGSLIPVPNEQGGFDLFDPEDQEAPVFSVMPPFMTDAKGERSNAVQMTLEPLEQGYSLTVIADSEWINSPERAFPVIIDPSFDLASGANDVYDTHVNQNNPTHNYSSYYQLEVGKSLLGSDVYRTYIKYALPMIPRAANITHAELDLVQNWARNISNHNVYLNVYQCLIPWSANTITWNNQPISNLSNAQLVDYTAFLNGMSQHYILDVTTCVKSWYLSGNYGLMLASSDESVSEHTSFYSSRNLVSAYPMVTVSYVSNIGLEDYWDYKTETLGDAGTAYVNTYTGGLIYAREDVSTNGLIFPVSVSHVFLGENNDIDGVYGNMNLGKGFRLNLIETIEATGMAAYPQRYTDADGTIHYVRADLHLEDNTNIYLSSNASGWTMHFPDGSYKEFNTAGYLIKIADKNGNQISINYTNNKITSVQDGAGKTISFTYNSGNYLTAVTDPAGRSITYTYNSDGNLTGIAPPDGRDVSFSYNNGKLAQIENANQAVIAFDHTALFNGTYYFPKISEMRLYEENGGSSVAEYVFIDYYYYPQRTRIRYGRATLDTLLIGYDNWGRAISYKLNNNKIAFTQYDGSVSNNTLNSPSYISNGVTITHNLMYQTELIGYSSTNAGNYAVTGSSGTVVCNEMTSLIGGVDPNGQASDYYYYTTVPVQANKTYSFGAYMLIENTLAAGSVYMKAEALNANDQVLETAIGDSMVTTSNGWKLLSTTITVPAGTTAVRVSKGLFQGVGVFYTESTFAEEADAIGNLNHVDNSTFSGNWPGSGSYTGALPDFYRWFSTTGGVSLGSDNGRALKITGDQNQARNARQAKAINGKAGDVLMYGGSGTAYCSASGNNNGDAGRFFGIRLKLYNSGSLVQSEYLSFDEDSPGITQTAMSSMKAAQDYDLFQIELCYNYEINYAKFDDVFVYRGAFGANYTYGSNGYPAATVYDNGNSVTYTYSGCDLVSVVATYNGNQTQTASYTYDANHNLLTATDTSGKTTTYTYPSPNKGLPTSVTVSDAAGTMQSTVSYTYADNGNFPYAITDADGSTITYVYNTTKGLLTSVTDPNGNVTDFTYDADSDLLLSVSNPSQDLGTPTTYFAYDDGRLQQLYNHTAHHTFSYDTFGQITEIEHYYRDGEDLYEYDNEGQLVSHTFANWDEATYTYTDDGQIKDVSFNNSMDYAFRYDSLGRLGRVMDYANQVTWNYRYDGAGRLTSTENSDGISATYDYDAAGNLGAARVEDTGVSLLEAEYSYDSANRLSAVETGGATQTVSYDGLSRVSSLESSIGNLTLEKQFTYAQTGTQTSGRIASLSYEKNGSTLLPTQTFTYDANGNITQIREGGNLVEQYWYDGLNRLVREDNFTAQKTYTFTYDVGSNLTSRSEYNVSMYETLGQPLDTLTIDYQYHHVDTDAIRRVLPDLMVDYDTASGNPGWYMDRLYFEWGRGTQLTAACTLQGDVVEVSYEYDANGLRTRKTVDNVNTLYLYIGSTLVRQVTGNETLCFSYGADGAPLGFTYNGTPYYYVTNLQGDVVAITDATGTIVVQYTYDAWGKLLMTSGTLASTIGKANPLRYRGYYYDDELELYYLQSRYYDPSMGRFISPDSLLVAGDYLTGLNRYAYCNCNPVMFVDSDGKERKVFYNVPVYTQGNMRLCWAVSQIMISDFYDGVYDPASVLARAGNLSAEENNGDRNQAGVPQDALLFMIPIRNATTLYYLLRIFGPLYASYSTTDGSGHYVVVTGVDLDNNIVYTNNPQRNEAGEQTFQEFMNGAYRSTTTIELEYVFISLRRFGLKRRLFLK